MKHAHHIDSLESLKLVDEIMISGGEPMLYPEFTEQVIRTLWEQGNPNRKIFLYTAFWNPMLNKLASEGLVQGIHYTLHDPLTNDDIRGFEFIQGVAVSLRDKVSFRAYIDPNIKVQIPVNPQAWSRLEIKPWIDSGECELPEDELFILDYDM